MTRRARFVESVHGHPDPAPDRTHVTAHVTHMGFERELAHDQIVRVLHHARGSETDVLAVIAHLKPASLRRAVADTMRRLDGIG